MELLEQEEDDDVERNRDEVTNVVTATLEDTTTENIDLDVEVVEQVSAVVPFAGGVGTEEEIIRVDACGSPVSDAHIDVMEVVDDEKLAVAPAMDETPTPVVETITQCRNIVTLLHQGLPLELFSSTEARRFFRF